jgi:hypothetical protein
VSLSHTISLKQILTLFSSKWLKLRRTNKLKEVKHPSNEFDFIAGMFKGLLAEGTKKQ